MLGPIQGDDPISQTGEPTFFDVVLPTWRIGQDQETPNRRTVPSGPRSDEKQQAVERIREV